MGNLIDKDVMHIKFGEDSSKTAQFLRNQVTLRERKNLRIASPALRSEKTEPYLLDCGIRTPKGEKLFEVTGARRDLRRNR